QGEQGGGGVDAERPPRLRPRPAAPAPRERRAGGDRRGQREGRDRQRAAAQRGDGAAGEAEQPSRQQGRIAALLALADPPGEKKRRESKGQEEPGEAQLVGELDRQRMKLADRLS